MPTPWPTSASTLAALAAATPRPAPNSALPVWPQGVASNQPAVIPTPWSNSGSMAAAIARLR